MTFRFAATALFLLVLCAAPGWAQTAWMPLFTYEGTPTDEIFVPVGAPFVLDVGAFVVTSVETEILGFSMDFSPTSPSLVFDSWTPLPGWIPILPYPQLLCFAFSPPTVSPPIGELHLGSISFTPAAAGTYQVALAAADLFVDPNMTLPAAGVSSVTVHAGGGPGPGPGPLPPPPVPADYNMGTVVNGDFEAGGGSLNGWQIDTWWGGGTFVQVDTLETDHVAHLHAEGEWWEDPGPGPGPGPDPWWWYDSGEASIRQTLYVPADANALTFVYATQETTETAELDGDPYANVRWVGQTSQALPDSNAWSAGSLPVPEQVRGHRATVEFFACDGGWGQTEWGPGGINTMDLYLDYIGINGSTVLQTTTWSAAGGGSWDDGNNWTPAGAPDNTMATAHDVVVPETAGTEPITLASARTVQSLDYSRSAGPLDIQSGGSLTVIDFADISGGSLQVQPGGAMTVEGDMTVTSATVSIHPAGSPAGGTALVVGGRLELLGGAASQMDIRDGNVIGRQIRLTEGATVTLANMPGFAGRTQLEASQWVYVLSNSTLDLGPGTAVVTPKLYVGIGGAVNVQSATIADASPGQTDNYGTVAFTGANCLVDQDRFYNYEVLTIADADVSFTGYLNHYDRMTLTGSTITVGEDFYVASYQNELTADADSTVRIHGDFRNYANDAAKFDLDEATVQFLGAGGSDLQVQGRNVGPFSSGLVDNFALGSLVVAGGTVQLTESGVGAAQYVRDLTLQSGTTLDLNGIPLYYTGTFTNNGGTVEGGEVARAYVRPVGLPAASITGYTASGTANDDQDSVTDAPLDVVGYRYAMGWEWGGDGLLRPRQGLGRQRRRCRDPHRPRWPRRGGVG